MADMARARTYSGSRRGRRSRKADGRRLGASGWLLSSKPNRKIAPGSSPAIGLWNDITTLLHPLKLRRSLVLEPFEYLNKIAVVHEPDQLGCLADGFALRQQRLCRSRAHTAP